MDKYQPRDLLSWRACVTSLVRHGCPSAARFLIRTLVEIFNLVPPNLFFFSDLKLQTSYSFKLSTIPKAWVCTIGPCWEVRSSYSRNSAMICRCASTFPIGLSLAAEWTPAMRVLPLGPIVVIWTTFIDIMCFAPLSTESSCVGGPRVRQCPASRRCSLVV